MLRTKNKIIIFFIIAFICILFIKYTCSQEALEISLRAKVEYTAEGLRDPFKSYLPETVPETLQGLTLVEQLPVHLEVEGIIWGGRFPQAIINNKVVKIGEEIEGARIIDISKDGVAVFYDNKEYNLSSPKEIGLEDLQKKSKGGRYE